MKPGKDAPKGRREEQAEKQDERSEETDERKTTAVGKRVQTRTTNQRISARLADFCQGWRGLI